MVPKNSLILMKSTNFKKKNGNHLMFIRRNAILSRKL